jgi:anti-sigma factor ChrR (cupin superfamily)
LLEHPTDDVLTDYAIDRSLVEDAAGVDMHLAACEPCRKRLEELEAIEKLLADPYSWSPVEGAPDRNREVLSAAAARRRREDAEADALLAKLIEEFLAEKSGQFLWVNIASNPAYHTAGVVRKLADAADQAQYGVPLRALALAETAAVIVGMLPETRYTAVEIAALRGLTLKQQANANRQLGRFDMALAALDRAERAYRQLPRPELDLASLTFIRATICYQQHTHDVAARLAEKSTATFAELGQTELYLRSRHLEGSIAFEQGEVGKAQVIFDSIYAYGEANGDVTWIARESQALGHCYLVRGDLANALNYFHTGMVAFRGQRLAVPEIHCRWGLALVLQRERRYRTAILRLEDIREEFVALGAVYDAALVTLDLMETFLVLEKPRQVRRTAGNIVRLFKDAGMVTGALTAADYLKQAAVTDRVTPSLIDYVRRFFRRAELQPDVAFIPPQAL